MKLRESPTKKKFHERKRISLNEDTEDQNDQKVERFEEKSSNQFFFSFSDTSLQKNSQEQFIFSTENSFTVPNTVENSIFTFQEEISFDVKNSNLNFGSNTFQENQRFRIYLFL